MVSESRKAYMREYNRTHREQVNASQKKYRLAHPDRVKESMRKYRDEHREDWTDRFRRYRAAHPEKVKATRKRYYERHREERIRTVGAWRKQHHDAIMNMSDEDFLIAAGIREVPDNADVH